MKNLFILRSYNLNNETRELNKELRRFKFKIILSK